jgi:hypothetical protein
MAFVIIGISPFGLSTVGRAWAQNIAAGVYAAASSSTSFSLPLTSLTKALSSRRIGCSAQVSFKAFNSFTLSLCGFGVPGSPRWKLQAFQMLS